MSGFESPTNPRIPITPPPPPFRSSTPPNALIWIQKGRNRNVLMAEPYTLRDYIAKIGSCLYVKRFMEIQL